MTNPLIGPPPVSLYDSICGRVLLVSPFLGRTGGKGCPITGGIRVTRRLANLFVTIHV